MSSDFTLQRKLTLRSGNRKLVLWKKRNERIEHVLMKAFLWGLYLPIYDDLLVEYAIGDRYKPDVISLDALGEPLFWGEAGKVGKDKLRTLFKRYPRTDFAIAKWNTRLEPYREIINELLTGSSRSGQVHLINFPADAAERFIRSNGEISVTLSQLEVICFPPRSNS